MVFIRALARRARAGSRRPRAGGCGVLRRQVVVAGRQRARIAEIARDNKIRERILLVDLGEHLDRSQMVLVELVTKGDAVDIKGERAQAEQLLAANRLYRETAAATGETAVGNLLDELERVLVEVAAAPDRPSEQELNDVRQQIEAKGLLFRVRIVSLKVRDRQREAIERRAGQRASTGV